MQNALSFEAILSAALIITQKRIKRQVVDISHSATL